MIDSKRYRSYIDLHTKYRIWYNHDKDFARKIKEDFSFYLQNNEDECVEFVLYMSEAERQEDIYYWPWIMRFLTHKIETYRIEMTAHVDMVKGIIRQNKP